MNKYNAKKVVYDGIKFDSKKEGDFYCELKMLKMRGKIKDFERQVTFELQPKFKYNGKTERPIKFTVDFVVEWIDGSKEVIEVKGMRTRDYILRRKMFLYQNPNIKFTEI